MATTKTYTHKHYDWELRRGDLVTVSCAAGLIWDVNPQTRYTGRTTIRYFSLYAMDSVVEYLQGQRDGLPYRHWTYQRRSRWKINPLDPKRLNDNLHRKHQKIIELLPDDREMIKLQGW